MAGQLDAPGLTLKDAELEALNLLGQTAKVSEVLWARQAGQALRRQKKRMKF